MGVRDIGRQVSIHSITSLRSGGRSELMVSRLTQVENTGTGSLVLFTTITGWCMKAADQRARDCLRPLQSFKLKDLYTDGNRNLSSRLRRLSDSSNIPRLSTVRKPRRKHPQTGIHAKQ
jgi:hypothetical protein